MITSSIFNENQALLFHRDFISEDDFEYREVIDINGDKHQYIKPPNTSWMLPIKGQEIRFDLEMLPKLWEAKENYFKKDEFQVGQTLALQFVKDYHHNVTGDVHRILIDSQGRKFNFNTN